MSKKLIRSSTTVLILLAYMIVLHAGMIHLCGCEDGSCGMSQTAETETGCEHCSGDVERDGDFAIVKASVGNQCSCGAFSVSNHTIEAHEQNGSTHSNLRYGAASLVSGHADMNDIDSFSRDTQFPQQLIRNKTIQSLRTIVIVA
jgi:hypothetical protein